MPDKDLDDYDPFQELQQALTPTNTPTPAEAGPPGQGDPRRDVLDMIREGRTVGPQSDREHVGTLAGLGFDKPTVADAIEVSEERVEELAEMRIAELNAAIERAQEAFDDE